MISGQILPKSEDFIGSAARLAEALKIRRVMAGQAAGTGNLLDVAAPAVDSAVVCISHEGERP
jgi:hypothetical protein